MKFLITFLIFVSSALSLFGQTTNYIRSGASGSNDGSDWANAYTSFPATLTRGRYYYVAAGSYGSYTFDDNASSDTQIYIIRATVANHGTETGWDNAYGSGTAYFSHWAISRPYYTLDGGFNSYADAGTNYGFTITNSGTKVVDVQTADGATGHYLTFRNVNMRGAGYEPLGTENHGLYAPGSSSNVVQLCSIMHINAGIVMQGSASWLIESNVFQRNWSDPSAHSEAIAASGDDYVTIRYNLFEDIEGTGQIVFLHRGGAAGEANWVEIYGNVFRYTPGNPFNRLGMSVSIAAINSQVAKNWFVYNNTFAGLQASGGVQARVSIGDDGATGNEHIYIKNNFSYDCAGMNHVLDNTTNYEISHNTYYGGTGADSGPGETNAEVYATTNSVPFVDYPNGNFRLIANTDAGATLSSPYNIDADGNTRTTWSRGAFEFDGAPPAPSGPTATVINLFVR